MTECIGYQRLVYNLINIGILLNRIASKKKQTKRNKQTNKQLRRERAHTPITIATTFKEIKN